MTGQMLWKKKKVTEQLLTWAVALVYNSMLRNHRLSSLKIYDSNITAGSIEKKIDRKTSREIALLKL